MLEEWHKILVATKKEQMQLPPDKFPAEKFLPGVALGTSTRCQSSCGINANPMPGLNADPSPECARWRGNCGGLPRRTRHSVTSVAAQGWWIVAMCNNKRMG